MNNADAWSICYSGRLLHWQAVILANLGLPSPITHQLFLIDVMIELELREVEKNDPLTPTQEKWLADMDKGYGADVPPREAIREHLWTMALWQNDKRVALVRCIENLKTATLDIARTSYAPVYMEDLEVAHLMIGGWMIEQEALLYD